MLGEEQGFALTAQFLCSRYVDSKVNAYYCTCSLGGTFCHRISDYLRTLYIVASREVQNQKITCRSSQKYIYTNINSTVFNQSKISNYNLLTYLDIINGNFFLNYLHNMMLHIYITHFTVVCFPHFEVNQFLGTRGSQMNRFLP